MPPDVDNRPPAEEAGDVADAQCEGTPSSSSSHSWMPSESEAGDAADAQCEGTPSSSHDWMPIPA